MKTGLVSVSFRKLTAEEIVGLAAKCGLEEIEWGGDIHVPLGDLEAARKAALLTREAGLAVSCYGSYVRMTAGERNLFPALIDTARALGAPVIRVWSGMDEDYDMDEIAQSTRTLCDMAEDIKITFEFHGGTLTHDDVSGSALMKKIDRPNARCQWQPPIGWDEERCLESIEVMRPWLLNVHVFSWDGTARLPLSAHEGRWINYLRALAGERTALLEFVQDDEPENLVRDAEALKRWLGKQPGRI